MALPSRLPPRNAIGLLVRQVLLLMSSILNPDPRHRLSCKGLWTALQFPHLWATGSSGLPLPDGASSFLTGVANLSRAHDGEAPPWFNTPDRRKWWTYPVRDDAIAPF